MATLCIVSKRGSKACKEIREATGITLYKGNKHKKVDAIINYGLAGIRLNLFFSKFSSARTLPIINKYIGCSKYKAVKEAESSGIVVPTTRLSLPKRIKKDEWLEKNFHSIGGIGINIVNSVPKRSNKYFQKFISNRAYELRVHAFLWTDKWKVQKRLGDKNVVAWNFRNGGHFQTVHRPEQYGVFRKAMEVSKKILEIRKMAFGAVDFVVDTEGNIFFLEVNSSPGFTELSKGIYVDAFKALQDTPKNKILKYCN